MDQIMGVMQQQAREDVRFTGMGRRTQFGADYFRFRYFSDSMHRQASVKNGWAVGIFQRGERVPDVARCGAFT